MKPSGGPVPGEAGFATVWVVMAMALVVAAAAVAVGYGTATVARQRAAAAADAAALGAALNAVQGPAVACREGELLARLDGAAMTRCVLQGAVSQITVSVRLPGVLAGFGQATGRARAGPTGELSAATSRPAPASRASAGFRHADPDGSNMSGPAYP